MKRVAELDARIDRGDGWSIGARTVMTDIAADERIRRDFPALAEAAAVVGSVQIRNRATLAGQHLQRVAGRGHGPGTARLRGARSSSPGPSGPRRIPIDDFFVRSGRHDARPAARS